MGFRTGNAVFVNGVAATGLELDGKHDRGQRCRHSTRWASALLSWPTLRSTTSLDRRHDRDDPGAELWSAGANAEPAHRAFGDGDCRATGDNTICRAGSCRPMESLRSRDEAITFTATAGAVTLRCLRSDDLHRAHRCSRHCINRSLLRSLRGRHAFRSRRMPGWHTVLLHGDHSRSELQLPCKPIEYIAAGAIASLDTAAQPRRQHSLRPREWLVDWRQSPAPSASRLVSLNATRREPHRLWRRQVRLQPERRPCYRLRLDDRVCNLHRAGRRSGGAASCYRQRRRPVVSASGTLSPIVLQVTDAAAHPVAGAVVEIHQTVDAWQTCLSRTRPLSHPARLGSSHPPSSPMRTGSLTITPQQTAGVAGDDEPRRGYGHTGICLALPSRNSLSAGGSASVGKRETGNLSPCITIDIEMNCWRLNHGRKRRWRAASRCTQAGRHSGRRLCAESTRRMGLAKLPVDVTLVDRKNHHLFQPLLYQVALAVLSPGDIAQPIRSHHARPSQYRGPDGRGCRLRSSGAAR